VEEAGGPGPGADVQLAGAERCNHLRGGIEAGDRHLKAFFAKEAHRVGNVISGIAERAGDANLDLVSGPRRRRDHERKQAAGSHRRSKPSLRPAHVVRHPLTCYWCVPRSESSYHRAYQLDRARMNSTPRHDIYGHRARIGYTCPPLSAEIFPYEFYKLVPTGVTLVLTNLTVVERSEREVDQAYEMSLRAAREL